MQRLKYIAPLHPLHAVALPHSLTLHGYAGPPIHPPGPLSRHNLRFPASLQAHLMPYTPSVPSPSVADRYATRLSIAAIIALAAFWLCLARYHGFFHDALLYTAMALEKLSPDNFRNDLPFRFGSQGEFSVFPVLFSLLMRATFLDHTACGEVLWFLGLIALARRMNTGWGAIGGIACVVFSRELSMEGLRGLRTLCNIGVPGYPTYSFQADFGNDRNAFWQTRIPALCVDPALNELVLIGRITGAEIIDDRRGNSLSLVRCSNY